MEGWTLSYCIMGKLSSASWDREPLNRQTNTTENITFPCTMYGEVINWRNTDFSTSLNTLIPNCNLQQNKMSTGEYLSESHSFLRCYFVGSSLRRYDTLRSSQLLVSELSYIFSGFLRSKHWSVKSVHLSLKRWRIE